jgi:hypothetical protein
MSGISFQANLSSTSPSISPASPTFGINSASLSNVPVGSGPISSRETHQRDNYPVNLPVTTVLV